MKKLLTRSNPKLKKGEKRGYVTVGLHFAPADKSGHEVCFWRSRGCTNACLDETGHGQMPHTQKARIERTQAFFDDKQMFLGRIVAEIKAEERRAARLQMTLAVRLNLTSDWPWEKTKWQGKTLLEHFPHVQWYDYTKGCERMLAFLRGEFPANYHLTFSRSESNARDVHRVMEAGGNVAVVFHGLLPSEWKGRPVINGDETDLRFLDPQGVIIGLSTKGPKAKQDQSGFVILQA